MDSSDFTAAAFNPEDDSIVIVAMNSNTDDLRWEFDLSDFDSFGADSKITVIRTSGNMAEGENWADVSEKVHLTVSDDGTKFESDMKGSSVTTFIIAKSE